MKVDQPVVISLITAAATIAIGAIGGFVNWLIRRQSAPVDAASVRKTEADTVSMEVKTARDLLADVKIYFSDRLAEQAADHDREMLRQREDHARELAGMNAQLELLTKRVQSVEESTGAIRVAYAIHRQWDATAWDVLRQTDPAYPPPPLVEGL